MCCAYPSSGVGTGLFHWLELKRRAGEATRPHDLLTLAVLTSGTGGISFSCWQDAAICPERCLFGLSICCVALTLTGHSQTIPTPLTLQEKTLLLILPRLSVHRTSLLATFSLTKLHRRCRGGRRAVYVDGQSVSDSSKRGCSCCFLLTLCPGGLLTTMMMVMMVMTFLMTTWRHLWAH